MWNQTDFRSDGVYSVHGLGIFFPLFSLNLQFASDSFEMITPVILTLLMSLLFDFHSYFGFSFYMSLLISHPFYRMRICKLNVHLFF
ncbi:hypothetical protein L228DRAFT_242853 [Xylona heveae TC161]|uniref:Uncharacterized protein n=1 Tax=Xylona heveae (strain CBS 132557 / TC161) TaxID=1328760 RepID=A0A165JLI3_XYLHT|nr:hypothetical protein L228DRAFT_242853 [Xylona heveae TC161]KZF26390.1 hypothetical protein L228DRAFT_242853 [Xylona heveae TC161]